MNLRTTFYNDKFEVVRTVEENITAENIIKFLLNTAELWAIFLKDEVFLTVKDADTNTVIFLFDQDDLFFITSLQVIRQYPELMEEAFKVGIKKSEFLLPTDTPEDVPSAQYFKFKNGNEYSVDAQDFSVESVSVLGKKIVIEGRKSDKTELETLIYSLDDVEEYEGLLIAEYTSNLFRSLFCVTLKPLVTIQELREKL